MEPVTLDQAKQVLLYDLDDQDPWIEILITSGRVQAELYTNQAFTPTATTLVLDGPVGAVTPLPGTPLASVETVSQTPLGGVSAVVDPAEYVVEGIGSWRTPGRLRWIVPRGSLEPVGGLEVAYTVGPADPADVPAPVTEAILAFVVEGFHRDMTEPRAIPVTAVRALQDRVYLYRVDVRPSAATAGWLAGVF